MVVNRRLTWNQVGLLILLTSFLGIVSGIALLAWGIFLAPPFASLTRYFYVGLAVLPPFVTLGLCLRARPVGRRALVLASPVLGGLLICLYLGLIGPAFYDHIQCTPGRRDGLRVQYDCQCQVETSGGLTQESCSAEGIPPLPFVRLERLQ